MKEGILKKTAVIETAGSAFEEFEAEFEGLREAIETVVADVLKELKNAGDTVESLPTVLAKAGEKLEGLREAFNERVSAANEDNSLFADEDIFSISGE